MASTFDQDEIDLRVRQQEVRSMIRRTRELISESEALIERVMIHQRDLTSTDPALACGPHCPWPRR